MTTTPAPSPGREPVPLRESAWKRLWQSRLVRMVTKFLALPLIGMLLSGMIIGRIANAFIGSDTYYIYVVGDENDPSIKPMMKAAAEGAFASFGKVAVKTEIRDDSGDPQQAETIAKELAKRPDVLMVVGHVYSTVTKSALPSYMGADPPIPVILTTETNPTLLPPPGPRDVSVPPVFRLFPTDANQAKIAAKFFADQHAKSVWVVEDTTNPAYSQYLAREFLKAAYDDHPDLKVILWSNNLNLPPYSVDKLGIDWVFFAGDWRNALVLVRQLKALPGTAKPKVLLSDASADKLLLQYGGSDVDGVYLLHPLQADVFTKDGYVVVGREASSLTRELIASVHEQFEDLATEAAPVSYRLRKWLGLRRVSDARRALARYMSAAAINEVVFTSGDFRIKMGRDEVTRAVIRKDATFHVWRIEHNTFVEVK